MRKSKHFNRIVSATLSAVLTVSGLTYYWNQANLPVSAKTLAELQDEREANEAKIEEKQKELDSLSDDIAEKEEYQQTLQEKIALQQDNLDIVTEELSRINDSLAETEAAISDTEDEITVMEADIEIGLDEFKARLLAMYVQGNDSLASALVGATDFYDLLSKYELMSRIANHDNNLVNDLKDKLEACNEKKAELEEEKTTLSTQQAEQQSKKEEFTSAILDLQNTYAETDEAKEQMEREQAALNDDVADLESQNEALDEEEASIKAAIAEQKKKEEEAAKKKEAEAAAAAAAAAKKTTTTTSSSKNSSSTKTETVKSTTEAQEEETESTTTEAADTNYSSGGWTWPNPSCYTISSGYGYRWGSLHAGIDIAGGNSGTAVVAAKGGTVIRAVSGCSHNYPKSSSCGCGGGYGNYVIISHDGTYSTVYGHMASINVSVGDYVSAGQTIGYVGSTGFSTGYHLHFEIRVNGSAVNPMNYL